MCTLLHDLEDAVDGVYLVLEGGPDPRHVLLHQALLRQQTRLRTSVVDPIRIQIGSVISNFVDPEQQNWKQEKKILLTDKIHRLFVTAFKAKNEKKLSWYRYRRNLKGPEPAEKVPALQH